MKKEVKKKLILTSACCLLMAFLVLLPPAVGYGSDFNTAEALSNGTHNKTILAADDEAYFKVECTAGTTLDVFVSFNDGIFSVELFLYNPSQVSFSSDIGGTSPISLSNTIVTSGTHYLRFNRFSGAGDIALVIIIEGANPGIPGFEMLTTLLGLIASIGLILLIFRNRIQINS